MTYRGTAGIPFGGSPADDTGRAVMDAREPFRPDAHGTWTSQEPGVEPAWRHKDMMTEKMHLTPEKHFPCTWPASDICSRP